MSRDPRKLRVLQLADDLAVQVYRATADFPVSERYGLQAQTRRAAVSVACNIVEGSARRGEAEYLNFLNVATASAAEVEYLIGLAIRLHLLPEHENELREGYRQLLRGLQKLLASLHSSR